MCGIVGMVGAVSQVDARAFVARGLDRVAHRGPDGRGVAETSGATHGHVRLALVDLSDASAQPFHRPGGGTLSFVGEIWNYRALRADLAASGDAFRTTGDTEVLAAALDRWGAAALDRLDGMFAFAFTDRDGRTWLARDRFGKIPLYVVHENERIAWASERRAFDRPVWARAVPPGHAFDARTGEMRRWYRVPDQGDVEPLDADATLGILRRAVAKRLDADAPVCVLASGGLDSSLVLALAREARPDVVAYAAVLDPVSADLAAARALCRRLGVELREVPVPMPTDALVRAAIDAIEIASKAQTEIALLCLPLAAQVARDGFKACLSGEGADELFGGYGNMAIRASGGDDGTWRAIRVAQLEKMSRGNFMRCNKVFMRHGVECRLPYLERELVERVLATGRSACPPGKGLLKRAAAPVVPSEIVRRTKQTFQGGAGMSDACAALIASPTRFYNAESTRLFGGVMRA